MKLSIVMPVYNGKHYINNSLRSLIEQTAQDFEVVVVDDGSTDGSASAAEALLAASGLHYQVLVRQNAGVSAARNQGLRAAKGAYVMFLDCDDEVSRALVEKIYMLLAWKQPDVICWDRRDAAANAIEEKGEFGTKPFSMNGIEVLRSIVKEERMKICTGSAAYRKTFLEEFRMQYTEGCANGEDQEFHYKLLTHAQHVIYFKESLMFYTSRVGSISNSYNLHRFDAISAINRAAAYMEEGAHPQLQELASLLKQQKVIENYFYNLQGCLAHSRKAGIGPLLKELDEAYPGLNEEVREQMKQYSGSSKKLQWKIRVFLFSPSLYKRVSALAG